MEEAVVTNIQVINMVREEYNKSGYSPYLYQPFNLDESPNWRNPRTVEIVNIQLLNRFQRLCPEYSSFKFPIVPVIDDEVKPCSYSDLGKITDFKSTSMICTTQSGRLFRGTIADGSGKRSVIIKTWDLLLPSGKHHSVRPLKFCDEIELLTNEKANTHSNLMKLHSYCYEKRLAAVYLYDAETSSLLSDMVPKDSFGWGERINVATQLADLLAWLHGKRIAVGPVSTSFIMIDKEMNIKVLDFGYISNCVNKDTKIPLDYGYHMVGWEAPEAYQGVRTMKSDVFIFGLLLKELISKEEFDFQGLVAHLHQNKKLDDKCLVHECFKDQVDNRTVSDITELTIRCLSYDPSERPAMEEVLGDLRAMSMGKREGGKRKRDENEAE